MAINPIGGINPAIAPTAIGQSSQSVLKVGLEYVGKIVSFDSTGTAEVQIGEQVFGMKLGSNFAVGDVLHFRARQTIKQLAGQMRATARARRAIRELIRIGPSVSDQFGHRVSRNAWVHDQHNRKARHQANRDKIFLNVIA
jgi:hypothetical protein